MEHVETVIVGAGLAGSDDDGLDVFHGSSRCLVGPR